MAPIRRYLRITRYSVLEVRIYLEQPSLAPTWLLSPRSPALPRIIAAVRPLVLPKLREENEKAKKKGGGGGGKKKKSTKDTVTGEDFEVAVFLTQAGSSHAILTKDKRFTPAEKQGLGTGGKMGLGRWLGGEGAPVVVREESEEEGVRLEDIPLANTGETPVHISSDEEEEGVRGGRKRKRAAGAHGDEDEDDGDDKKKLGLKTEYEGFSIYGRILCLIVKRRGVKARAEAPAGSSQMLESWVSTQLDQEGVVLDDDG